MRRAVLPFLAVVIAIALVSPSLAQAQNRPFGLGIVVGAPTGLTAKYFVSPQGALDMDLAYDFVDDRLWFSTDYLFHFNDVITDSSTVELHPYLGGGGVMAIDQGDDDDDDHGRHDHDDDDDDDFNVGVRFTGGLAFYFPQPHLELFADVSPGMWLIPETDFHIGAVLGLRYFF
ncbi:MAG: hypothetical protein H6684_02620 [Deltaproteobacteria bacterium]|nr:hypothetical protein [bacterium]MCB9477539.1 hypothetical protein [Deltaproteobacteria bacterium]MCB9478112.1 hypothetical protein [Deltaproteobacteria bacterium]MCB9487608.1 hypothetical protein [Deltaproteobacteria bacterium]